MELQNDVLAVADDAFFHAGHEFARITGLPLTRGMHALEHLLGRGYYPWTNAANVCIDFGPNGERRLFIRNPEGVWRRWRLTNAAVDAGHLLYINPDTNRVLRLIEV